MDSEGIRRFEGGVDRRVGAVEGVDWMVEPIGGVEEELEERLGFEALDFLKRRLLEAIWLFGCEEAKNYELARSLVGGQDGTERTLFQACAWTLSHWFNPRDGALNHNHPRIFSIRGLLEFTLPFQEARGPI